MGHIEGVTTYYTIHLFHFKASEKLSINNAYGHIFNAVRPTTVQLTNCSFRVVA
jgi:hypothetical protein